MRRLAILAAFGAPLCACATTGQHPPVVPVPVSYEAADGRATLAPAALDRWWTLFADPELNALEDEAFRSGPDALTAEARIMEARATRNSEVAQTLPSGKIQGNASREHAYDIGSSGNTLFPVGGVTDSETANFNVSWELDLFGRLALARRIATADLAANRFNIEGARASLAASVADNYFQARGLVIQIADADETVRIDEQLERVAARKAELGLGAQADADRVAGDLAQARALSQDLQAQLHAARRQILILVGRGAASTDSLPLASDVADAPPVPAAVPGQLLERRPDVREAEARLQSERATASLRHRAIFPTFTLLPGLGLSKITQPSVSVTQTSGPNPTFSFSPAQQTTSLGFWTLGGGVSVPVLDIPHLLYDAKAEDARARQSLIAYQKVVQTAYGEADNALVNLGAGERAAAILVDGEARAKKAYLAARTRYGMGLDDLTSALSAEQAWRSTRVALTGERVQALRRAVVAYKALGGGWAYSASVAPR